jgi:hypothetical protein
MSKWFSQRSRISKTVNRKAIAQNLKLLNIAKKMIADAQANDELSKQTSVPDAIKGDGTV